LLTPYRQQGRGVQVGSTGQMVGLLYPSAACTELAYISFGTAWPPRRTVRRLPAGCDADVRYTDGALRLQTRVDSPSYDFYDPRDVLFQLKDIDPAFRTLRQDLSTHVHANWVFTALGRYQLTFEVTATTVDGTPLAPARATYTWYVGGTQPGDMLPDQTQTTLSVNPTDPPVGTPVTLAASITPASAAGYVEFFDGTTSLGFTAVTAGQADLSTSELAAGPHQLTARYTQVYDNDYTSSTSPTWI
jgi:surface-anchored protein